jgi:glutathione synthase/RimK-type ligase-like ATP-grasp enzyme
MKKAIGIYREYNPLGKNELDRKIIDLTAEELRKKGFEVETMAPEDFNKDIAVDLIFTAARKDINKVLMEKEKEGVLIINSPEAITFSFNRKEVYKKLMELGANIPETEFVLVDDLSFSKIEGKKVVLKPANRHELWFIIENEEEFNKAIEEYKKAGVNEIVVQAFVEGKTAKYYVPGGEEVLLLQEIVDSFPSELIDQVKSQVRLCGKAIGLKVFGGDFIISNEKAYCVDTNDWPSFSVNQDLTQEVAAAKIANYIEKEYNNFLNK